MNSIKNKQDSLFNIGDNVTTNFKRVGEVIGVAEYIYGWDYRIKFEGGKRTLYRHEWELNKA
jgi:hypothetical protein